MTEFTLTIDAAGAQAAFRYIADRAANLTPAMDDIEQMLLTSTDQRFERQVDPDGKAWLPNAPSTAKAKRKAGHELILQWSTRLRRSIVGTHDANSVTIGTNMVYAAIQQFGGVIHHFAHSRVIFRKIAGAVKGSFSRQSEHPEHDVIIPARRFVGISEEDKSAAIEILRDFVTAVPA